MNPENSEFHWISDWNGYEVGHPEVLVVGLYSFKLNGVLVYGYIDVENNVLLESWPAELVWGE